MPLWDIVHVTYIYGVSPLESLRLILHPFWSLTSDSHILTWYQSPLLGFEHGYTSRGRFFLYRSRLSLHRPITRSFSEASTSSSETSASSCILQQHRPQPGKTGKSISVGGVGIVGGALDRRSQSWEHPLASAITAPVAGTVGYPRRPLRPRYTSSLGSSV